MRPIELAAVLAACLAPAAAAHADVIFRASPQTVLPAAKAAAPTFSVPRTEASTTGGATVGPPSFVRLSNAGELESGPIALSLASDADFAIVGGDCVPGSTSLRPGASCTVGVARKASYNDSGRTTRLEARFATGGSSSTEVFGSASGFAQLSLTGGRSVGLQAGQTWDFRLVASGGARPYSFRREGTLPSGVEASFSADAYSFSGSTQATGSFANVVTVTDAVGNATTANLDVAVAPTASMSTTNTGRIVLPTVGSSKTVDVVVSNAGVQCALSIRNWTFPNRIFDASIVQGTLSGGVQAGSVTFTSKQSNNFVAPRITADCGGATIYGPVFEMQTYP